ncbi:armadillo-type protein [Coprinopsis sp. MPI-PUGE-AT-0042]|nr:armadillo-type protein [Coprinopsis sp. MPI-PUGE-AT-0042]
MKSPLDGQADALSQLEKDMDGALSSDDWSIRRDAIVFLSEHVDSTFADLIENTIPSLPHVLLTDDDYDVQDAAIVALEKFAVHPNYAPASLKALFVDLDRYMEFDSSNQKRFISLIAQLIREGGGGEDQVGQGLQYLLSLTIHHDDKDVRDVGREALASLCSANLPVLGSVKAALHPRVNQGEAGSNESVRWKEVIIYLMQKDSVRSTCCAALQLAFGDNPSENPSETIEVRHVSQSKLGQPQHILDQSGVDSSWTLLTSIVCMEDVQQSIRLAALRTLQFMLLEQDIVPRWDDFRGLDDGLHEDSNPEVRVYYLNLLVTAAKKDESSKVFKRAIARCAQAIRPLLSSNKSVSWGMESAAILGTLAKNRYLAEGIPRLVAMAVKDEDKNVRKASLQSLAEFVAQPYKNPSSVQAIMAGLGKKLNTIDFRRISQPERLAWVGVLSALSIHAADSDIDRQKLIDLAITDGDATVRAEAYKGLHELIQDSKLRDGSNRALVNGFKSALRSSHWYKRYQIVESLRFDVSSMAPLLIFNTILQPLVAPLMKVALNDQSEFVRDAVQSLLTFLITHASAEGPLQLYDTDIRSTILSAITDHIVLFSDRDKLVAFSLIEAMPENITDDVVSPFARGVIRLLKNPHVPTRATALEILTILYRKGVITSIIHSHLSDIVTLALEDDHNGTRVIALKLLTSLCSDDKLRRKFRTAQPTLMSFLENHDLRSTTVELISVLAQDQSVRQLVANWVVSVIASDSEAQIEGMMALLLRLVVEKRPDANPKRSEILFFIAPAFVLRRSMAKSQARLTALLWTNYQDFVHEGLEYCQELPQSLIDCFVTAVFGHHVAQHELKEWLKLGEYLKPTESGEARQTSAK